MEKIIEIIKNIFVAIKDFFKNLNLNFLIDETILWIFFYMAISFILLFSWLPINKYHPLLKQQRNLVKKRIIKDWIYTIENNWTIMDVESIKYKISIEYITKMRIDIINLEKEYLELLKNEFPIFCSLSLIYFKLKHLLMNKNNIKNYYTICYRLKIFSNFLIWYRKKVWSKNYSFINYVSPFCKLIRDDYFRKKKNKKK